MKIYKLPKSRIIYNFTVITLATIIWVSGALYFIKSYSSGRLSLLILIIGSITWITMWYEVLTEPIEIKIQDDNSVEFHGLFKQTTLAAQDIKSVGLNYRKRGRISVRHTRGSVCFYKYMPGWNEIVQALASIMESNKNK